MHSPAASPSWLRMSLHSIAFAAATQIRALRPFRQGARRSSRRQVKMGGVWEQFTGGVRMFELELAFPSPCWMNRELRPN